MWKVLIPLMIALGVGSCALPDLLALKARHDLDVRCIEEAKNIGVSTKHIPAASAPTASTSACNEHV
ncbi:MAG: hypothetical protein ACN6OP_13200 [Pseudomonadales bacterium]